MPTDKKKILANTNDGAWEDVVRKKKSEQWVTVKMILNASECKSKVPQNCSILVHHDSRKT